MEAQLSRADGGRKGEEKPSGDQEKTAHRYPVLPLPPPSPLPPPPPLPPTPSQISKAKGSKRRRKDSSGTSFHFFPPPPSAPPPPPPPLPPPPSLGVKIKWGRQRSKGPSIISVPSFSSRNKETKENAKIPAPPPLPPPPSLLRNLFANLKEAAKIRRQRVHSVTIPPPPPPPPRATMSSTRKL